MISSPKALFARLNGFRRTETGAISVMNLFFAVGMAIFSGVAIDMANLISAKTQLQVAADTAAHTALYMRDTKKADVAKEDAVRIALENMPKSRFGEVLKVENVHFGYYDRASKTFKIDETSDDAVWVETERLSKNANPVTALMLSLVGFTDFDMRANAVYETYMPWCLREGFVAEEPVDIQSNNGFENGFCVHSNTYVSVNIDNTFEAGTVVSMPNASLLDLPSSGFEKNDGLSMALREGRYRLRVIDRFNTWWDAMVDPDHEKFRSYIDEPTGLAEFLSPDVLNVNSGNALIAADALPKKEVHDIFCNAGAGKITLNQPLYENIVIRTDCKVVFGANIKLRNVVIMTKNSATDSLTAPNGVILGEDDGCAEEGSVQLLTKGGVKFAADMQMYGSQIIAAGDVEFTANANGVEGASIVAGGTISGTSNMQMGFCGTGMSNNFDVEYFRLAG